MLKIDDYNNIVLTRGDTLTLKVNPKVKDTGEDYEPQEGDSIRFAVSKNYKGDPGYELILSKNIPIGTLTFTCSAEETSIDRGQYYFDVEITYSDGTVDTFIQGDLTITGEAE